MRNIRVDRRPPTRAALNSAQARAVLAGHLSLASIPAAVLIGLSAVLFMAAQFELFDESGYWFKTPEGFATTLLALVPGALGFTGPLIRRGVYLALNVVDAEKYQPVVSDMAMRGLTRLEGRNDGVAAYVAELVNQGRLPTQIEDDAMWAFHNEQTKKAMNFRGAHRRGGQKESAEVKAAESQFIRERRHLIRS